jgi:hypothetical protein
MVVRHEKDILNVPEEAVPRTSVQYSQVTIGLGRTRSLGPKKLNQFLNVELGLREWLEPDEPDDVEVDPGADTDEQETQTSFSELEADDDPSLN